MNADAVAAAIIVNIVQLKKRRSHLPKGIDHPGIESRCGLPWAVSQPHLDDD